MTAQPTHKPTSDAFSSRLQILDVLLQDSGVTKLRLGNAIPRLWVLATPNARSSCDLCDLCGRTFLFELAPSTIMKWTTCSAQLNNP